MKTILYQSAMISLLAARACRAITVAPRERVNKCGVTQRYDELINWNVEDLTIRTGPPEASKSDCCITTGDMEAHWHTRDVVVSGETRRVGVLCCKT